MKRSAFAATMRTHGVHVRMELGKAATMVKTRRESATALAEAEEDWLAAGAALEAAK